MATRAAINMPTGPGLKVSIVIPTVDREKSLLDAVSASAAQIAGFCSGEIVVVDNSADGRQFWIVQAAQSFPPSDPVDIRYVKEPNPGLAHARNKGVTEARGQFVVFLDDDELPRPGWLAALISTIEETEADAAFGGVAPVFEERPVLLADFIAHRFTRMLKARSGEDVSARYNYLGTGNSCFRVATCFADTEQPFDFRFNDTGGEDTDLLRRLFFAGKKLVWAGEAVVEELIPTSRTSMAAMRDRRFAQGQIRTLLHVASSSKRYDKAMFWMAAGAAQFIGHSLSASLNTVLNRGEQADIHRIKARGGLGKLLWQPYFRKRRYGTAPAAENDSSGNR
jgi:succinoglycan biosynthesis protein ExoM